MSEQRRVLVVGGGLAGLAATLRLETAGVRVTLLEATPRLGGGLAQDVLDGIRFDTAIHALPADVRDLERLVEQAGLSRRVRIEPLQRVEILRRGRVRSVDLARAGRLGLAPGVPPWEALRLRRLHHLLDWFGERLDPHAPEGATRLDDRSVADFARLYLGTRLCERLLEPLLEAPFGLRAEATSRVLLFLLLDRRGQPRLQLGFGLGALPERLAEPLRDVRTGARVTWLRSDGRGVRLATGEELDASAVVLALPAHSVLDLLPNPSPVEEVLLARCRNEPRTTLAVVADPAPPATASAHWIPPAERGLLAGVFRVPLEAQRARGRALFLLAGRPGLDAVHGAGDERGATESLLRGAEWVLPGLRAAVSAQRLYRSADAVASFDVGHYRGIARLRDELAKRRDERRVFLAGDWMSAPHLEGAASSGLRAADAVLEALG